MGKILRDPGAEVIVGLLGFATAFVGIGLAIAALNKDGQLFWLVVTAFVVCGLLFSLAVMAIITLVRHMRSLKRLQTKIAEFMRQGYVLRMKILKDKGQLTEVALVPTLTEAIEQWVNEVQKWLDTNLPELAPDFGLDTIMGTNDGIVYSGLSAADNNAVLRIEQRVRNLREILREIRR